PDLSFEQKVEILQTLDVERRLELAIAWANRTLADLELKEKIGREVAEGMDKRQREFLLREQLEAIRKELGEADDGPSIAEEFRAKIAASGMPEQARQEAERELARLQRTSPQSPEYGWIRTYLDWMTEFPWDRRTYVGALPGRIVRALKDAGTKNPVLMLDEIDKVGADWRGDPSSALLEVLDPAQNHTFRDHYLGVDLDLSEVLFIATGNVVETIAEPLLDR